MRDTLSQNHDVVIIDNLATGRRENVEHLIDHPGEFIEGSITDLDLLREAFPGGQSSAAIRARSVKRPLDVAAKDCGCPPWLALLGTATPRLWGCPRPQSSLKMQWGFWARWTSIPSAEDIPVTAGEEGR